MKTFTSNLGVDADHSSAFTLIEMLMVVSIIAILSTLGFAVTRAALQAAAKAREIGAAKTLISAYASYSAEFDGMLLPSSDATAGIIELPNGDAVSGPTAQRYPYRLAPYFDFNMKGTILVNRNASQVDESNHYLVSLYPALGINHQFVGGSLSNSGGYGGSKDILTSMSQAASAPIVFISSSNGEVGQNKIDGYCNVEPPNLTSTNWKTAEWTRDSPSKDYGHVDARYHGKAVCAHLDGSVALNTIEQLRDMRLWSNQASLQDDPDYRVKSSNSGGGRR